MMRLDQSDRRWRIYSLNPQLVMELLCGIWKHSYLAVPFFDLPEGFQVVSVQAQWEPQAIDVMIWHPSFNLVREGEIPPRFGTIDSRIVHLERNTLEHVGGHDVFIVPKEVRS